MTKNFHPTRPATAIAIALTVFVIQGCAMQTTEPEAPAPVVTAPLVKPEIDYSSESPDCETAAQRLTDNVEVGMTLGDVRRLVGSPLYRLPTTWWWSRGLSKTGKPYVEFPLVIGEDNVKIAKIVTDSSGC